MKRVSYALAMVLLYAAVGIWVVGLIFVAAPVALVIYLVVGVVLSPLVSLYFRAVGR